MKPEPAALAALFLCLWPRWAGAAAEDSWPSSISVHYQIRSPRPGLPLGLSSRLERIHRHLSRELRSLNRWMDTERIDVYLYPDRRSYVQGRFHPPPWSGGAAIVARPKDPKILALIAGVDEATMAHELTHLFLNSYFAEQGRHAPKWINEGLAKLIEHDIVPGERGAVVLVPDALPLSEFLRQGPQSDDAAARVSLWYRQAESVVRFLRHGSPFKFNALCKALREDMSVERALFQIYAYPSLPAFERAWLKWSSRQRRAEPVAKKHHPPASAPAPQPSSPSETTVPLLR